MQKVSTGATEQRNFKFSGLRSTGGSTRLESRTKCSKTIFFWTSASLRPNAKVVGTTELSYVWLFVSNALAKTTSSQQSSEQAEEVEEGGALELPLERLVLQDDDPTLEGTIGQSGNEGDLGDLNDKDLFGPSNLQDSLPPFTAVEDEELVTALSFLNEDSSDKESHHQEEDLLLLHGSGDTLSDIDLVEGDLLEDHDYTTVFDETDTTPLTEEETAPPDDSLVSLEEELSNLNLKATAGTNNTETNTDDDKDLPLIYCQPCTPQSEFESPLLFELEDQPFSLPAIDENEPIPASLSKPDPSQSRPNDDFEEDILKLSLLKLSENDSEPSSKSMETPIDAPTQGMQDDEVHPTMSCRPEAAEAARPFLEAFTYKNERSCFGHKETIFGLSLSECASYLATASQDSTVCIWNAKTNSLISTLNGHSKDFECLRTTWASSQWGQQQIDRKSGPCLVLLASAGADGIVKVWASRDASQRDSWSCVCTIDHNSFESRKKQKEVSKNQGQDEEEKEEDIPQVYALQFIDNWKAFGSETENSFLMTSSDDYVHLWEFDEAPDDSKDGDIRLNVREVMSIRFHEVDHFGGGCNVGRVTSSGLALGGESLANKSTASGRGGFGGDRNPDELVYVFDASYCPANGLLGVALSDGTLRLLNGRGICVSILQLPGCQSHLTSFAWDSTGLRLSTCVATGHLILWDVDVGDGKGDHVVAKCTAVLEGGHQPGRPLFGARYCGGPQEDLIVSWGVDGILCLWDSRCQGQVHAPLSTLARKDDYPIYAVDIETTQQSDPKEEDGSINNAVTRIAVGGGREAGFLGVPVYLYNVQQDKSGEKVD